ncbi:hypothetical protein L3Y34_019783 [Caenorhabditis briggsae]|uniref:Uncharacterized protein n=1 Tax=Caenorhabditis briggsae TaxID=6238 RepID=A0AAE9IWK3_CAEBR|nr:hypothetical protein L3Y34_019783 [Caenorhabditis briggsae]
MSSWDPPLDTQSINTTGFLCALNDQILKFYTLEHGLLEIPISDNGENLVLGKWYSIFEGDYEAHFNFEMTDCKVWADTDGQVFAQVMAIGPNDFALPREIRDKYRLAVWSPFLKFLVDKEDLFNSTFRGGDVGEIVVKFAPSKDHPDRLFEVVQIVERDTRPQNVAYAHLPPWTMEFLATRMEPVYVLRPSLPIVNRYGMTERRDAAIGICIKVDVKNPAYSAKKAGSLEKCCVLFSPRFGLTKLLVREMVVSGHKHADKNVTEQVKSVDKPSYKLGKWYKYQLGDNRYQKSQKQRETARSKAVEELGPADTAFYNAAAVHVEEVEQQKYTKVMNGDVEIDTSFAFNHEMLEDPGNQELPWEIRSQKLSKTAHFVDVDIGRVEVYPNESQFILQKIETHRKMLEEQHPSDYSRLKNEMLIVRATVKVHNRFMANSEAYPNHGIFIVRKIMSIFYLNGGKMIYDMEKEEEKLNLSFGKLTL